MPKIAGALAVVLAAVVAGLWLMPASKDSPAGGSGAGGGKAPTVKVDEALAKEGEQLAQANGCTSCHTTDGASGAGPTWKGVYGSEAELTSGQTVEIDDTYISEAILDPGKEVKKGFSAGMPSFKGKLDGKQVAAITEYIKSLQ